MRDKIARLLEVKSIVTVTMTVVFAYLAVTGRVSSEQFMTIFTAVVSFYFGVQLMKSSSEK